MLSQRVIHFGNSRVPLAVGIAWTPIDSVKANAQKKRVIRASYAPFVFTLQSGQREWVGFAHNKGSRNRRDKNGPPYCAIAWINELSKEKNGNEALAFIAVDPHHVWVCAVRQGAPIEEIETDIIVSKEEAASVFYDIYAFLHSPLLFASHDWEVCLTRWSEGQPTQVLEECPLPSQHARMQTRGLLTDKKRIGKLIVLSVALGIGGYLAYRHYTQEAQYRRATQQAEQEAARKVLEPQALEIYAQAALTELKGAQFVRMNDLYTAATALFSFIPYQTHGWTLIRIQCLASGTCIAYFERTRFAKGLPEVPFVNSLTKVALREAKTLIPIEVKTIKLPEKVKKLSNLSPFFPKLREDALIRALQKASDAGCNVSIHPSQKVNFNAVAPPRIGTILKKTEWSVTCPGYLRGIVGIFPSEAFLSKIDWFFGRKSSSFLLEGTTLEMIDSKEVKGANV